MALQKTKIIEIDGQKVVCKIVKPGKAYGCETFTKRGVNVKLKYKSTRKQRLQSSTEIKTRRTVEENETLYPIVTEGNEND